MMGIAGRLVVMLRTVLAHRRRFSVVDLMSSCPCRAAPVHRAILMS